MESKNACRNLSLVVFFFGVLILRGVHALEELEFAKEPTDAFMLRKQAVTLECAVQGLQPLTVQWLHNRQAISPNEGHQVLNNGSLFMPSVLPKRDSGEYQCCVSNEVGRICSCPVTVTVANVPKYIITQEPAVIQRGGVLKLECLSRDYPVTGVIWRLGKEIIVEDQRKTILPNGVLQISRVDTGDAGNYRCLTENVGDSRIKSPVHAVDVVEPTDQDPTAGSRGPDIVVPPQPQRLKQGETALFECLADGDSLRVTWSRDDGQPIKIQDVNYLGGNNLQLLGVTPGDEALYRCTVENTVTGVSVEATAQLTVVVPPTFRVTPNNFYGPRGSTARFSCSAAGNPSPTIRWLHNGDPPTYDSRIVHQLPWDDLVIIGVWHEDMGAIQCVAENEGGSIQAAARLKVKSVGIPPDSPQNIHLVAISPSIVMVTWVHPANKGSGVVAYTIHYKAVNQNLELQEALNEDVTRAMITDLTPHTNYSFYMLTWTTNGPSDHSKLHYVVTDESRPSVAPRFSVASNTPTTIMLNWHPLPPEYQHGVITKYRITVRESGEESWSKTVNNASLTEYTLQNLLAGRIYQVRMAAGTDKGFGTNSDWVTVHTRVTSDPLPPAPHFELQKLNQTALSISVATLPPSRINLRGFKLYCSVYDGGIGATEATADPILLPLNTSEYILTGLVPETTYVVRLLLYTAIGDGHETIQDITMGPEPDEPILYLEPPTNLALEAVDSRIVRLTWHAPDTTQLVVRYEVRYWPQGNTSLTLLPFELDLEKNNTINEVIVEGLDPFTVYEFDVRAVSTKVLGLYCDAQAVRTLEDRPSTPPKDILAKPLDPHAVKLQWQPPMEPNGVITHYVILFDQDVAKPEDKWNQQARNGTFHQSTVDGLASNTKYYFKVRAGTQVGEGPPTDAVAAQTLIAERPGLIIHPWQEGLLIGACSAFVLIVMLIFVVICSRRGLFKNGHGNSSGRNDGVVCTGYVTGDSGPDSRMYVMGSVEGREQNGFTAMAALPQPRNLDTKGGTLIINGNGPVRNHCHHHHCASGGVIPSRFPRSPGPCSADPDTSSQALLPGSESVTNSDLGEENSQGKSEASSSSGGFCPYSQDVNHRKAATQHGSVKTSLPPCSACCLGQCPQLSDSSTGSYGEPVAKAGVNRTPVSPTQPSSPHSQSQGLSVAASAINTGVKSSNRDDAVGGYYSDGKLPDSSPTHQSRNELTWPRHTGRVLGRSTAGRYEATSVWQRRTHDVATNPHEQGAESGLPQSVIGSASEHARSNPSVEGEDTSPDFISKVLDEFSSGTCSTTV